MLHLCFMRRMFSMTFFCSCLLTVYYCACKASIGFTFAAFMAGMPSYHLGGRLWPSVPVGEDDVVEVLGPLIRDLRVWRLPADPTLPYEHDGVLLATARQGDGQER